MRATDEDTRALADWLLAQLWQAHEWLLEVYEGASDIDDAVAWVQEQRGRWEQVRRLME